MKALIDALGRPSSDGNVAAFAGYQEFLTLRYTMPRAIRSKAFSQTKRLGRHETWRLLSSFIRARDGSDRCAVQLDLHIVGHF